MFFEILAKMRQKPEYVRYQIALWGSVLITGGIATIFIVTQLASGRLGSIAGGAGQNGTEEVARVRDAAALIKPDNIFQTENVFDVDGSVSASVMEEQQDVTVLATTTTEVAPRGLSAEQDAGLQQTNIPVEVQSESE
jgi:hypothetical protein